MVTPWFARWWLRGDRFGNRQRVPVIRPPVALPELLTDHQTEFNEAVQRFTDLANGDGQERKPLLEVADEFRGRQTGVRGAVDDPTRLPVVTGNDTDPERDLLEAEGLEGGQCDGNG